MSTKSYILNIKLQIDNIIKADSHYTELLQQHKDIIAQLQEGYNDLMGLEEAFPDEQERTEMFMAINESQEELNKKQKEIKEELLNYVKGITLELNRFAARRPGLFEKLVLSDISDEVLNHCLDAFTLYENNQLSVEQAKELGYYKYHHKDDNQQS